MDDNILNKNTDSLTFYLLSANYFRTTQLNFVSSKNVDFNLLWGKQHCALTKSTFFRFKLNVVTCMNHDDRFENSSMEDNFKLLEHFSHCPYQVVLVWPFNFGLHNDFSIYVYNNMWCVCWHLRFLWSKCCDL